MSKSSIKEMLAKQAAANIQQHRDADYSVEFDAGRQHTKIALDRIHPSPYQPRLHFSEDSIRELAESIAAIGLTQPITVRRKNDDYELVAGERRLRAHRLLNKPTIESIVVDVDDATAAAMALSENIDREDLTDFEVSEGMRRLEEEFSIRSHLAKALGISRSEMYRYLAFRELPAAAIDKLRGNPGLLGRRAASDIVQAIKAEPKLADQLLHALALVETGELEQGRVVPYLQNALAAPKAKQTDRKPTYLMHAGSRVGSIVTTPKDLVIKVSQTALSKTKAKRLQAFVTELLAEAE
ncbi:ParB/RepB/Spo0J family partition protein [Ralstonia pseudosolanacearum]|uniref:ParB/RepB/Spo0J family partition protein n=1 Tax=Ralstonia pseudosolanacearum TaxID=1310165 RepID=UPI003CEF6E3B